MISSRLPSALHVNELTRRRAALHARGVHVTDLTESNPTRAGIEYPTDLLSALGDAQALRYDPAPFGLMSARAAVASDHARRGVPVDPSRVVLAASTSEAYAWLFKLLCNPGDRVLVPRPSYPLFEHLTRLEAVRAEPYDLDYHHRWEVDLSSLRDAPPDTRVLVLVSPNNPTGSFVSREEVEQLTALCLERGWTVIADEVFADYPLDVASPYTDIAARSPACLTFTLGGLSKSLGLPQLKLSWLVAGGPALEVERALTALELIADSFLSVSTPVQVAAPALFERGDAVRASIRARIATNLARLRQSVTAFPACQVLRVEGGWSAVVRVPATRAEEQLVIDVLDAEHILVHPGYFFDFPREAYVIVSLLTPPDVFGSAIPRVLHVASR